MPVITVRREGLLGQREVPLDRLFARRRKAPRDESAPPTDPATLPDQSP